MTDNELIAISDMEMTARKLSEACRATGMNEFDKLNLIKLLASDITWIASDLHRMAATAAEEGEE